MIIPVQALCRRDVREDVKGGFKLGVSDTGLLTGKEVQGGGVQGRALPVGCTLSGEVSLEDLGFCHTHT